MTTLSIPGANGSESVELSASKPLFILGRNGTGKSALIHALQIQLAQRAIYLPGARTSVFDQEGLHMTSSGRREFSATLSNWDSLPDTRWRMFAGNARNEKAIHDLTMAETQYKMSFANAISEDGNDTAIAVRRLQEKNSPLDRVNLLLEQANVLVRIVFDRGELKANQDGRIYSLARMSDGERTALILIAEVVAAPDGAAFLIDEPEIHLHRSIVVPLISSLMKLRLTCEFIISTHELDLPAEMPEAKILIVRSASWNAEGTITSWDFDLIDNVATLPENLRTDLLGSRRKILFTEGTDTSLDRPMYAVLFPTVSVRPKGSCGEVIKSVAGVKATVELHRAEAYGLIDNDGMATAQIADHGARGVYALSVFAVESLYYAPELMLAVALRQAETANASEVEHAAIAQGYLDKAKEQGVAEASKRDQHLASRIAERQLRDSFIHLLPTREQMIDGQAGQVSVELSNPYPEELTRLQALIGAKDLDGIIARYPVRESGALGAIAKALKFQSRVDYESAALARMSSDKALLKTMRDKLLPLSNELMS